MNSQSLTPHQIVQELDKYIIGQNEAKKNVAIATILPSMNFDINVSIKALTYYARLMFFFYISCCIFFSFANI